jgi:hypothetical protein
MITPKDLERDRRTQVALRPQWHQYPIAGIMNAHRRPRCGTEYQIVWPMNVAGLRERMMAAPVAAEMNTRRSPVLWRRQVLTLPSRVTDQEVVTTESTGRMPRPCAEAMRWSKLTILRPGKHASCNL